VATAELTARSGPTTGAQTRISDAELRRLIDARTIAWGRILACRKSHKEMDAAERFAVEADSRIYCDTESAIVAELRQRPSGEFRHKGRRWLVVGKQLVSRPAG
jgi:hypothetical protein